jgi:hypothetical protein
MTIQRWYGIELDRDPECSACGQFLVSLASRYGVDLGAIGEIPDQPGKEG